MPRRPVVHHSPKKKRPSTKSSAKGEGVLADVQLGARTEYRIYPSIGIARIGNSTDSFFIGPEAPGVAPSGPFRGNDGGIKPQAARFRIYKVEIDPNENETVTGEVVPGAEVKIEWSVKLANRKAAGFKIEDTLARVANPSPRNKGLDRNKLIITASGSVTGLETSGPVLSGKIEFAKSNRRGPSVDDIALAILRTDEAGRLLVIGGPGKSGSPVKASIESFSDNDGWYDSVSDGPVSAALTIDGQSHAVIPSWVVVTVPRYAPETYGIVTWYDRAVNMARTRTGGGFDPPRTTSFSRDIFPILRRADELSGVHGVAHSNGTIPALSDATRIASFNDRSERAVVLSKLTPIGMAAPDNQKRPPGLMPRLYSGANPDPNGPVWTYLALTQYQMAHIENWVHGNFDADWPGSPPPPTPFNQIPVARQAWALTEAALEACVGGPFYPGIEGTYDVARPATYHPQSYLRREFRIDPAHPPGFLTEKMALPWQADFADCTDYWWPSQRPDFVTTEAGKKERWDRGITGTTRNAHRNMVEFWVKLGFVVRDPGTGAFIERERTLESLVS